MMQYNLVVIPLIIITAVWLNKRNKPRHLLALAIIGFAVVYGPVAAGRLQIWNVFHYYLGAKYFDELGYYDMYSCASSVGKPGWVDFDSVRNLYRYSYEPIWMIPGCPVQNFTPDRIREFQHDVRWLHDRPSDKPVDTLWPAMFRDKGLNTTPFWLSLATPLANLAPIGGLRFWLLMYSDFLLIVAGFIVAARRYDLARVSLSAVFLLTWAGTYPQLLGHWFQYPWLFFVLVALGTFWKHPSISGGALLSAAVLRIFPGVLFLVPLLQWRTIDRRFWRGVGTAGAMWALLIVPIGPVKWVQFIEKMAQHSAYIIGEPGNIGLRNLIYSLLDWPGAVANWGAFASGEAALAAVPNWVAYATIAPALVMVGGSVYAIVRNAKKRLILRFSDALPAIFGVLVLSRYYYAVNAIFALESEPEDTNTLLLISLLIFCLIYYVHPLVGYLVGQAALLLFYWRQIWK